MKTSVTRFRLHRGSVLFFTLVITGILGTVIGSLLSASVFQRKLGDRHLTYTREFAAAEFALNKGFGEVSYSLKKAGLASVSDAISQVVAPRLDGFTIDNFSIVQTNGSGVVPVSDPDWPGYNLTGVTCRITARAKESNVRFSHPGVTLQQDFLITRVPLYVFGIFYANDLEIHPSQQFSETGRVHTNADFFFGSDGNRLEIQNKLSAVGEIQYGRHPNSGRSLTQGRNHFWNGDSAVETSRNNRNVDHDYNANGETWASVAQELWGDNVRDSAMGVASLNLPWPETVPNIEIIRPPSSENDFGPLMEQKFCYKAGLIIEKTGNNITAYKQDRTVVPLTYVDSRGRTQSVVSQGTFYNERQNGTVRTVNIDMGKMNEAGIAPANGIIYVMNNDTNGAVRLVNGSDLPGNQSVGLTVATPQPMYVQGDYNSVNQTVSMLACDALNVLSQGWNDADNTQAARGNAAPQASGNLTMNAVVVAGNVPTQIDRNNTRHYSGGVENFFRYLEKWGGNKSHIFNGSIINLYGSERSAEFWDRQQYDPPRRQWAWDSNLALQGPPGSPITYKTTRTKWQISTD